MYLIQIMAYGIVALVNTVIRIYTKKKYNCFTYILMHDNF